LAPVVQLRNAKNEFMLSLIEKIDDVQYWFKYFGISELFGPDWIDISAPFCCWNKDFCRSAAAFAVAEQNIDSSISVEVSDTHSMP